jgi:hypothetical protein
MTVATLGAALLCCSVPAAADVYRWVDDQGVVHYSDKPPTKDAKPVELPKLETFPSGSPPSNLGQAVTADQHADSSGPGLAILTPEANETFRGDSNQEVIVTITVPPKPARGVIFYYDGTALNADPTHDASYTLTNVERGQHTVEVALIGQDGKELERSTPVVFFMKPSTVKH